MEREREKIGGVNSAIDTFDRFIMQRNDYRNKEGWGKEWRRNRDSDRERERERGKEIIKV